MFTSRHITLPRQDYSVDVISLEPTLFQGKSGKSSL